MLEKERCEAAAGEFEEIWRLPGVKVGVDEHFGVLREGFAAL